MNNPSGKGEKENSPLLEEAVARLAKNGRISCAEAMQIAAGLGEPESAVGRMLDQMGIRLGTCQLGLLGCIHPENRTVTAAPTVSPELAEELRKSLQDGCLPCAQAWRIAEERKIPPMDVSAACEHLGIRIKPCLFGIF
ncbi:hypothetical protein ACJ77P_10975 [Syntrophus buswellii]|uniref:hypothetical protein n=1 Tax=Syntrophus buswellii TaxID=43774 RepID=UPI0038D39C65